MLRCSGGRTFADEVEFATHVGLKHNSRCCPTYTAKFNVNTAIEHCKDMHARLTLDDHLHGPVHSYRGVMRDEYEEKAKEGFAKVLF